MSEVELVFGAIQTAAAFAALGQIVSEKRRVRAERFRDALSFGPGELDTFVEVFATSDAFEALVTDAFRSACEADAEHRVRALAAIVRRGLNGDDAVVSAMRLAERAVHDLENVDVRLLLFIASAPRAGGANDVLVPALGGFDIEEIRSAVDGPQGTHESVIARLIARGLIEDCAIGSLDYKGRWAVTEFGLEVLVFLLPSERPES